MVVGSSASKFNSFDMADSLDIAFESLNILSPSSKMAAEKVLLVKAGQNAGDNEDDTESFNEEDCLFVEGGIEEDEAHEGAFSRYSKESAWPNPVHSQPHSASRTNEDNELHGGPFSHYSRAFAWLNSASPQANSANRSNSGRPRLNSVCPPLDFVHCEKENAVPRDSNVGHNRHGIPHIRLQNDIDPGCHGSASCDDWSSPLDITPASPNTAAIRRSRRSKKSNLSVRESLLAEAWERKRELMLNEELADFKERAKPELLGRSSSDCGKLIKDVPATSELRRSRTRSLTDDDFEELRGCIDLGFRFDQSSIPDLCGTLPALEVYCAVTQNFQDSPKCMSPVIQSPARCSSPSTPSWKISSPGDDPQDVKGRLKHWAQAVACNARHCY